MRMPNACDRPMMITARLFGGRSCGVAAATGGDVGAVVVGRD